MIALGNGSGTPDQARGDDEGSGLPGFVAPGLTRGHDASLSNATRAAMRKGRS